MCRGEEYLYLTDGFTTFQVADLIPATILIEKPDGYNFM
jgi:hypothetical protein